MLRSLSSALLATAMLYFASPSHAEEPAGLVAAGRAQFQLRCVFCHDGASAPHLSGVAGRKVAAGKFRYSDALKSKSASEAWTDENLDALLKDSAAFAPGTDMMVEELDGSLKPVTIADPTARAALIAYLKSLN